MKISKETLEEIILQELDYIVQGAYGAFNVDHPELEHKKSPIQTEVNAILGNLKQIDKIVRTDDGLDRKTLVSMKEKALGDLYQGISYVESTIDDLLRDKK
tara:strand:+ start:429 stop:731 length:303 start_codon:yes stop_codon:yes gene_type:complete